LGVQINRFTKRFPLPSVALLALVSCGSSDKPSPDAALPDGAADTKKDAAVDIDATTACAIMQDGVASDDYFVRYRFTITSIPSTISITMTSQMEMPMITLGGAFGEVCSPAQCGGNIPASNPSLTIDYAFTAPGDYQIRAENVSVGGPFHLEGVIDGDLGACATWH